MRLGMSGNAVSVLGVVLAFVAALMLASSAQFFALMGALLFLLVSFGDCVDGNIARAKRETGPMGDLMDALGGYTVYAVLPLALGFRVENVQEIDGPSGVLLLLGALFSVSNLYTRLVHQKYVNMTLGNGASVSSDRQPAKGSFAKRVSSELGLVGWMMPLLLGAVVFGLEWLYLLIYAAFYGVAALVVTMKTALLAYRAG